MRHILFGDDASFPIAVSMIRFVTLVIFLIMGIGVGIVKEMRKLLLSCLFFSPLMAFSQTGSLVLGDVNHDEAVDISDVVMISNYILGNPSDIFHVEEADITGDGVIDISDVVALVNIILNGENTELDPSGPPDPGA